MKSKKHHTVKR